MVSALVNRSKQVLIPIFTQLCKKIIFFKIEYRIRVYILCLLLSIIFDVVSFPPTYFSSSKNPINLYFVKVAWAWNLALIVPFVVLTSYAISRGKITNIILHLLRIVIVTFFWWFWTNLFHNIDIGFGFCSDKSCNTQKECRLRGSKWYSVDISGHTFILIFGSLFLIEEAYSFINWPLLKYYIKREDDNSSEGELNSSKTFKSLSENDTEMLKWCFKKFTPYINSLFIGITILQMLWDIMLIITILYYHISYEKIIGGGIAILSWYFIYRICDKYLKPISNLPGLGSFYKPSNQKIPLARKSIREDRINIIPEWCFIRSRFSK